VVVAVGLTVIGVPLVTAIFPGVFVPVPLTKTAVSVALDPASIAAGLAAKLVMEGGGGVELDEPPHPAKATRPRLRAMAHAAGTRGCLKEIPMCNGIDYQTTKPSYVLSGWNCQYFGIGSVISSRWK
jgi:hypothetical protein